MIALMPLAIGQTIDYRVIEGLRMQSVPCSVIVCATSGVINSQGNYCPERIQGEINSRSLCVQNASKLKGEYILSIDRDIVLTNYQVVQKMVDCLNADPMLGAVSLWLGKGKKVTTALHHISIQCCLFRRNVFQLLDFSKMTGYSCTCETVKQQIASFGLKIRYLDFINRGFEIK